jgi:hypothetical protein
VHVRKYWWWIRLALFIVMFLGLGVYLFQATPWRRWIGLAPDYSPLLERGNRIVDAVHAFRARHGLWPQYLEDLEPVDPSLLEPPPRSLGGAGRWFYDLTQVPDDTAPSGLRVLPSLSIRLPEGPRAHVGYDFDPLDPVWHFFGNIEEKRVPYRPPPSATRPAADQLAAALAEMDRRIGREPGDVEHRRALSGLLMSAGRVDEVRAVVAEAARDFPVSYWPRLAAAVLDLPPASGGPVPGAPADTAPATPLPSSLPPAVQAFAQWVQGKPAFTHWFYLSHLERAAGRPDAAAAAMAAASRLPVEVATDDPNTAAYYLWDMTRWALESKRWALAIELADAWQQAHVDKAVADASYLPLRAVARLATGNMAAAHADLAAFDELPAPRRAWAKNIEALRDAVGRGNVGYRYSPGKLPGAFEVFPRPE